MRPLLALLPASCVAQSSLDQYITGQMSNGGIPGVSAAVMKHDQILWSSGYGTANPPSSSPAVDADTMFMFASVSKTYTGAAAMVLHERGWVDFDADVNTYLPSVGGQPFSVRNPAHPDTPVTLHHLLTHSSSIRDSEYFARINGWYRQDQDPADSLGEFCHGMLSPSGAYWASRTFASSAPGDGYSYSNVGAACGAYVVEVIAQRHDFAADYDELVRTHLHAPLGLADAAGGHFFRTLGAMPPPQGALPDSTRVNRNHYSLPDYPAACWRSSAATFARFMGMVINRGAWQGRQVLTAESVQYMLGKSGYGGRGEEVSNGLWLYEQDGSTEICGHDGGEEGVHTEAWYDTSSGVGFVILTNGEGGNSYCNAVWNIADRLMDEFDSRRGNATAGRGPRPPHHPKHRCPHRPHRA